MKHILVTYASKHGSTAEIAAAIASTLKTADLEVDFIPVQAVTFLGKYDAVVLGSAVYAGHWLDEAADFLKRFEEELAMLPVWLFSSGPSHDEHTQSTLKTLNLPKELQPLADHITPRDIALFYGRVSMRSLSFTERLVMRVIRVMHVTPGDFREWDEIEKWALHIREEMTEPA